MRRKLPAAVLLLFLGIAVSGAPARASEADQGGQIEELIVTATLSRFSATKSDTPIMETARSVSVETQQQILDRGALNIADTYVYKAGVFGETYGYATRGDWVRVRGLDVPEYRDSLQGLFGNYNSTRVDIYTVEQVEILKGPASVLYGRGSPGGLVNVVSKLPNQAAQSELVADAGNFERFQLAGDLNGSLGESERWLFRVIGLYRQNESQVNFVEEEAVTFAPSITWLPTDQTELTLLANYQKIDGDTGAQFLPVAGTLEPGPDGRRISSSTYAGEPSFNRYDTESASITLLGSHRFNATWALEGTARITDSESDYQQAWTSFIGGDRHVYDTDGSLYEDGLTPRSFYLAEGASNQAAIDLRTRINFATGNFDHEVLAGVHYQEVDVDDATSYNYAMGYNFLPDPATWDTRYWLNLYDPVYGSVPEADELLPLFESPTSTTKDLGLYVNDHIVVNNWHFTIGVRFDDAETDTGTDSQKDDEVSGSFGILYEFDNGISPYLSYAESFEPVAGTDITTGSAFAPQQGKQWEAGLKYLHAGTGSYLTAAVFDIEQSNLPNPNDLPNAPSQQEGVAEIQGIELEGVLVLNDFFVELSASHLDTENPDGYRLATVPEDQASVWLGYRPDGRLNGFRAGGGLRYIGASWDGIDTLKTPSYTLADLMIGYQTGSWDLAVNVRNLADKKYYATCLARGDCFPGERRTLVGRVAYRF